MVTTPRESCFQVPAFHRTLLAEYAAQTPEVARVSAEGDSKVAGFGDGFVPELYHRLFSEVPNEIPAAQRSPAAAVRSRLHDLASELPEFDTLRKQCVRDPVWAGMAATAVGQSVATALPAADPNAPPPDAEAADRLLDGMKDLADEGLVSDEQVGAAAGKAFAASEGVAEQASSLNESAVRTAMRAAIADAQEQIDQAQSVIATMGGTGTGSGKAIQPGVALALARKVRNSAKLARIIALAGRLQATARAKRATRSEYARSEIAGVERTGDIARLLPVEMAGLGHPVLCTDVLRRVTERTALGYKVRGKDKTAKGPLIVVIDQSGSMEEGGAKDVWAKAVALAILDTARAERRAFGVILYDERVTGTLVCTDPDKVDPGKLLDLLSTRSGGGTNFLPAMDLALDWIEGRASGIGKLAKSDVVHITDGESSSDDLCSAVLERADHIGAHIYGIGIKAHRARLARWSHEVVVIDDVSRDTAAVDLVFDHI
jgi:uncharacterized protein with von Willebrand factor type A (vWA) domain